MSVPILESALTMLAMACNVARGQQFVFANEHISAGSVVLTSQQHRFQLHRRQLDLAAPMQWRLACMLKVVMRCSDCAISRCTMGAAEARYLGPMLAHPTTAHDRPCSGQGGRQACLRRQARGMVADRSAAATCRPLHALHIWCTPFNPPTCTAKDDARRATTNAIEACD